MELHRNLLHTGQDQQFICIQLFCQTTAGIIFLNNRTCTLQFRTLLQNRDSAAAAGDDDLSCVKQCADRIDFYDLLWLRCSYDSAVTVTNLGNVITLIFFLFRFLLIQHTSDDFNRFSKSFVIRVYGYLCQDRGYRFVDAFFHQFCTDRILQVVSDITLAHGRTHGHWCVCIIRMILSEFIHCHMDHTHLGCITVRNHDLCALFYQLRNDFCSSFCSFFLLRQRITKCPVSQSNDNFLLLHVTPSYFLSF